MKRKVQKRKKERKSYEGMKEENRSIWGRKEYN